MPELPDLEVFSQNIGRKIKGKKLLRVVLQKGARVNVAASKLKKALEASTLSKIYREGKELRFAFANKNVLGLHLMLKGRLQWFEAGEKPKHVLLQLFFEKDLTLHSPIISAMPVLH